MEPNNSAHYGVIYPPTGFLRCFIQRDWVSNHSASILYSAFSLHVKRYGHWLLWLMERGERPELSRIFGSCISWFPPDIKLSSNYSHWPNTCRNVCKGSYKRNFAVSFCHVFLSKLINNYETEILWKPFQNHSLHILMQLWRRASYYQIRWPILTGQMISFCKQSNIDLVWIQNT